MARNIESVRAARRRHYERNKDAYIERAHEQRRRLRQKLADYKSGRPCARCGVSYPSWVMDFHHRDPTKKEGAFSQLVTHGSWRKILMEINKCDLVCANCHRLIHGPTEGQG